MRIMLVNTYYYPEIVGGAEKSVQKLAEELTNSGHDVTVLCTCKQGDEEEIVNGVKVIRFKPTNVGRRYDLQFEQFPKHRIFRWFFYKVLMYRMKLIYAIDTYNFLNSKKIRSIIDSVHPEVIHTNGLYEITPVIWKVAHQKHIRVIHTIRDYYLLCINGNLKKGKNKTECIKPGLLCRIRRLINKKLYRYVDTFTSPSKATANLFSSYIHNIEIIPNAIDFDKEKVEYIAESRKSKREIKPIKLAYVGALSEFKGITWIIDQLTNSSIENLELHFAGDGPLLKYLQDLSIEDRRVVIHGFLNETELNQLLQECDALICPSLWEEPFGRIVLDAYKNAMPVITSGRGGLGEIVGHGQTGFILDMNAEDALDNSIHYIFDNRENYKRLVENCVEKLELFSIEYQANMFLELYKTKATHS